MHRTAEPRFASPHAIARREALMRWPAAGLALAVGLGLAGCGTPPSAGTGRIGTPARPAPTIRPGGISRLSPAQSEDIAIHALGLVGTPYRYGGNTPEGGFDCSGLIGYVYRANAGNAPPRTVAQLAGFGQSVDMGELRTGDLVLFGTATPWHAGIYVGSGRFVHAPSTGGEVRMDRLDGLYWARQAVQARRP